MALFHLEILYYLAICTSATIFKGFLPTFIDILGYVFLFELMKICFLLSFEGLNMQKGSLFPENKKRNGSVPKVKSLMIFKMCESMNINVQLALAEEDTYALKPQPKKKKPLPLVRSVIVHEICQALGLATELNTKAEFQDFKLPTKMIKETIPIVQSEVIFKFCEALDLKVALANPPYVLK
ncbi:hypothetical protein TNCV_4801891 [Trichonephila clavipes]|nr:hypothetical protein TNCV_4801891 [Trichonephila clavipes]